MRPQVCLTHWGIGEKFTSFFRIAFPAGVTSQSLQVMLELNTSFPRFPGEQVMLWVCLHIYFNTHFVLEFLQNFRIFAKIKSNVCAEQGQFALSLQLHEWLGSACSRLTKQIAQTGTSYVRKKVYLVLCFLLFCKWRSSFMFHEQTMSSTPHGASICSLICQKPKADTSSGVCREVLCGKMLVCYLKPENHPVSLNRSCSSIR